MKKIKLLSLLGAGMLILAGCNGSERPVDPEPEQPDNPPVACTHSWSFVSDGESGHHEECSLCHEAKAVVPHRFDEGTAGTGVVLYECLDCHYQKTEIAEVFAAAGVYSFDTLPAGDITERTKLAEGIYLNASSSYKFTVDANAKAYTPEGKEEVTSTNRLKANGASQHEARTIEIKMEKAGRIIAYTMTSSSSDLNRQIAVWDSLEAVGAKEDAYLVSGNYSVGNAVETKEFHIVKRGTYQLGVTSNASNFYAFQIIYDTCEHSLVETKGTDATCGARGTTVVTCSKCDLNVTVADKVRSEHTWDEATWKHENGQHWHECSVCHAVMPDSKAACTPDETKHVDGGEPTASNPVTYQEDTCLICGGVWQHDQKEYVAPDQSEIVIADASKWTDTSTSRQEHKISDYVSYIFATSGKLVTSDDAAGQVAFKLDPPKDDAGNKFDPNMEAWTDRYFKITGVNEGDTIKIVANSGGSARGIKFGFTEEDKVVVPKSTTVEGCKVVEHLVTKAEAASGVHFAPYTTNSSFIISITLVKGSTESVIADGSTWTDTSTSRQEHKISDNCSYIFAKSGKLATNTDAAGEMAFKLDPPKDDAGTKYNPNTTAWTDRYFKITGVSEGDTIKITANSGGGSRGITFGFAEADRVVVPKKTVAEERIVIEHVVTASEATNGVCFAPYTTDTIFISLIVWVH